MLILAGTKLAARLLASDFACANSLRSCPSENLCMQTRCKTFDEKMKARLKYLILPFLGLLIGCASGQLKTTELKTDEAIIVAKAFINNNGERIQTKWNFLWNERLWGKNAVWVEKDGFVSMKLPKGKYFISLLQYNQYRKNIPDNYLTVELEPNKIYYIGDLTFNWNISKDDVANTGVVSAISDAKKNEPKIQVDLTDNYENTVKEFNEKYGNSKPVEKKLIRIEIE